MTKEELIQKIKTFDLEAKLKNIIIELINSAKDVNNDLLEAISDLLNLQMEYYEKTADLMLEEYQAYDHLRGQFKLIEIERYKEKLKSLKEQQQKLLSLRIKLVK
jgi:hypothetical protein